MKLTSRLMDNMQAPARSVQTHTVATKTAHMSPLGKEFQLFNIYSIAKKVTHGECGLAREESSEKLRKKKSKKTNRSSEKVRIKTIWNKLPSVNLSHAFHKCTRTLTATTIQNHFIFNFFIDYH